jgi:hypothetical protein
MNKGSMLRKGNRVKFEHNGVVTYGVVSKGGSKRVIVVEDGGVKQVKAPVDYFELSDHPLPKDAPSAMDKYSLKGYKEINGHGDSRTFEATICKNGKPILTVMNDGWGGCNCYQSVSYHERTVETEDQFKADVKSWMKQFNCNMIEPEDTWVEWWQVERPYGVTAEAYLHKFTRMLKEI